MTNTQLTIIPAHWESLHTPKVANAFKTTIEEFREAFMMEGYDAFFQMWGSTDLRGGTNNGTITFCSMGIRKSGKQDNGNKYSILTAFGFYYEDMILWPDDYVDTIVERAIKVYEKFLDGTWQPSDCNIYDKTEFQKPKAAPVIDWDALEEDEEVDPLS